MPRKKPKNIGHGVVAMGFGSPENNEWYRDRLIAIAKQSALTVAQVYEAFCSEISQMNDPIVATGEAYVFAEHRQRMVYLNKPVPSPDAVVNLYQALKEARYDLESVNYLLDHRLDCEWGLEEIKLMLSICVNQRDWSRFWSVRHFDAERRDQFLQEARTWDQQVERLEERLEQINPQIEYERSA